MLIELKDVTKRFGKTQVLKGISTQIPQGSRVALIGPNGSGKSTLIRALLGLIDCDGDVLLDGHSPYENRVEVAKKLAYVPQIAPQMSAPVDEILRTICITRELPRERIADVARKLDLDLDVVGKRPFRNLSGGMKQKLLIAIALAARPTLLVLDEPTASLDVRSRERFFQLFDSEVAEGVTVILCSHRLEEIQELATHVLALDEGRVSYDGPAGTLTEEGGRSRVELLLEAAQAQKEEPQ